MWWTYVLTAIIGVITGFGLAALVSANPRDEKLEAEDFKKSMEEYRRKKYGPES